MSFGPTDENGNFLPIKKNHGKIATLSKRGEIPPPSSLLVELPSLSRCETGLMLVALKRYSHPVLKDITPVRRPPSEDQVDEGIDPPAL